MLASLMARPQILSKGTWNPVRRSSQSLSPENDDHDDALLKKQLMNEKGVEKRTMTTTSQQDVEDAQKHDVDDLTETESAISSQSDHPNSTAIHLGNYPLHHHHYDPYSQSSHSSMRQQQQNHYNQQQAPPLRQAVYSFARAGINNSKLFLGKLPVRKPHARSESEFSESDFLPFTPGTIVSTKFGLGSVVEVRNDGITAVRLQSHPAVMLYTHGDDDEYHQVPALVHDWVQTPAGEGCILKYDPMEQMYDVRISGEVEYECKVRQGDVQKYTRRSRRGSIGGSAPSSVLQKGLSTAIKQIVSTSSGISASTYQFVSNRYYQGQCVITTFGPGWILSMDAAHKTVQVQLTWGATAYLRADTIKFYPKALVGMEVTTKFGAGIVQDLRPADAIYTVRLHDVEREGESDIVYVPESDITRAAWRLTVGNVQKQVRGKLMALAQMRFMGIGRSSEPELHEEPSSAGI